MIKLKIGRFTLTAIIGLSSSLVTVEAQATPQTSHPLLNKPLPEISGLMLSVTGVNQSVITHEDLIKRSPKGFVLTLGGSWRKPCQKGFKLLSASPDRFKKRGIKLFLLLADDVDDTKELMRCYKFDWATGISDKFKRSLGRYQP